MDAPGLLKFIKNSKSFDRVLEKIKILTIGEGKCVAELKVDESHTNPMGGLHGGLSATLVDCISTYALMSKMPTANVSVDIHLSYLKGAKVNDDIIIDASVIKTGKTLAFLEVDIKNKATGDVLVKGSHTKFLL
ncbi:acyl-coenzyme A thioesterase 13-like [Asbolus verrucosus]|uniref:Acyl-coenzyme A thioesterase 13-like n=1 Tax=Asbolus verrucosus TaxID=1661398 RepID=A0A482VKV1_ASBVE|nr:acyl-coenzyme A thioesterase 13-like [Asbolus verrucosus]